MRKDQLRALVAFGLVALLCAVLMVLSASGGFGVDLFAPGRPIASLVEPQPATPAPSRPPATAVPVTAAPVTVPAEPGAASSAVLPEGATVLLPAPSALPAASHDVVVGETAPPPTTPDGPKVGKDRRAAERAAEKDRRAAERAAEKDRRAAERVAEKDRRAAERAAEKDQRAAEREAARTERDAAKASRRP